MSEVLVTTAAGEVSAVITTHSVKELGLAVGDKVSTLIKATNVSLRKDS